MSIETEFGSTITNVKNAYQGLDNLGATIPQNKTIENIKNCLDEIYNNLPKTSYAEGSNITLSNTLKGKLDFEDGIVGYGDTKQNTYQGYNLLEPNFESYSSNGVTITNNNNGTFTLSGTASADTNFVFKRNWQLENNTQYRVSGCPSGGSADKYFIYGVNFSSFPNETGSGVEVTAGTNAVTMAFRIKSGVNVSGLVLKPMVTKGTTQQNFEPFVGNSPSPSPSYPQDIEVVRGKNRFDGELLPNSYNPTTGEIEASSTSYRSNKIPLQKNETYYLSGITGNVRVLYWNNTSYVSSEVITMPNSFITKGNIIAFQFDKSLSHENIMIEKGSQATSYLPYNTIEVVERGKNEFNGEFRQGNQDRTDVSLRIFSKENNWKLKVGKTYTISTNIDTSVFKYALYMAQYPYLSVSPPNTYLYQSGYKTSSSFTFTCNYDGYFGFTVARISETDIVPSDMENIWFQVEENNQATTYEPYQTPHSYQLSLGDKKLYDECYIVGSPDNWKYVDNYAKKTMSGSDIVFLTGGVSVGTNYRYILQFNEAIIADKVWCTYAPFLKDYGRDSIHFYLHTGQFILFVPLTQNELRAKANETPIEVVYPLATPIETPITDETLISQLNAWYNAHSNNGTTIIEIDGQLPLIIKVRALKGE